MAKKEERLPTHFIERARSGRSACASCGGTISDGEIRLSEAVVSDEGKWARAHQTARIHRQTEGVGGSSSSGYGYDATNPEIRSRFHHLTCAATHQPYKLRSALAIAEPRDVPDLAALEAAIERALSAVDAAEENEATRDEYRGFIERLRDEPDDDLQLVFGDWLQKVADPRGELMSTQHGLETATGDDRLALVEIERKLLATHRKQLVPERIEGTLVWRRGFIHRVELTAIEATTIGRALAHPSSQLVRELAVKIDSSLTVAANLPRPLPSTLQTLSLASKERYLGAVGSLLENALPKLERLVLDGTCELAELKHPTLAELDLTYDDATAARSAVTRIRTNDTQSSDRTLLDRLLELDRRKLPKLRRLILRVKTGMNQAVAALADSNVVGKLDMLGLHGDLTLAGLEPLRIAKVKLGLLDVRKTGIAVADAGALAKLAKQVTIEDPKPEPVVSAPKQIGEWRVRHTRKPEWGIGRVVEETDGGLQVDFEHGGEKLVRNVELLEEIK